MKENCIYKHLNFFYFMDRNVEHKFCRGFGEHSVFNEETTKENNINNDDNNNITNNKKE